MAIDLQILTQEDYQQLYRFELENRTFFEEFIPSRGEEYFNWDSFCRINDELLKEQMSKGSFFFLIRNKTGQIVGRINLVAIDERKRQASVGYRISEAFNGQGIASIALNQLLTCDAVKELRWLEGQTTMDNIASQRVFEKNQFKQIYQAVETFELNGEQKRFVYYKKDLQEGRIND